MQASAIRWKKTTKLYLKFWFGARTFLQAELSDPRSARKAVVPGVFQGALEKGEVWLPGMDKPLKIDSLSLSERDFYRDSSASNHGGVTINDGEMAERQKSFIARTLKTVGSKFFEGKAITELSLHVSVFESRSFLEKLVDDWDFLPTYLTRAALATDPVERIKLVSAFVISGFYRSASLSKPFNPILGETYQARWKDGTEIFLEQSSHHPPVTHWVTKHPEGLFTFMGFCMFNGRICYLENCVKTRRHGVNIVEFKDGSRLVITMPLMALRGLIFGERRVEFLGAFTVYDEKNGLVADFSLNLDQKFLGVFSSSSSRQSDVFRGVVYKPDESQGSLFKFSGLMRATTNGDKYSPYLNEALLDTPGIEMRTEADIANAVKVLTAEKKTMGIPRGLSRKSKAAAATKGSTVVCTAEGTYMGYLDFGEERYWDIRKVKPERAMPGSVEDVIPTDARLRGDVRALRTVLELDKTTDAEKRERLFDEAQKVKEDLEKRQRSDKKLREGTSPPAQPKTTPNFFPKQLDYPV